MTQPFPRHRLAALPPVLAALSIALLLSACGGESGPGAGAATGEDVAAAEAPHPGQAPYEAKCAACHTHPGR